MTRALFLLGRAAFLALLGAAVIGGSLAGAAAASHPAVGSKVDAKLVRPEGGKVRLSELRGRPLLIDFWATWCLPCREQARVLDGLRKELTEREVSLVAVDLGEEPDVVRSFLAETPSGVRVLVDRYRLLGDRLGVDSLPALALLGADGRVLAVREGPATRDDVLELLRILEE